LERFGGQVLVADEGDETLRDGIGGSLGELLVDDGLGKVREAAFLALETTGTNLADDLGKNRVGLDKVGGRRRPRIRGLPTKYATGR
jgi:hypothetical protein